MFSFSHHPVRNLKTEKIVFFRRGLHCRINSILNFSSIFYKRNSTQIIELSRLRIGFIQGKEWEQPEQPVSRSSRWGDAVEWRICLKNCYLKYPRILPHWAILTINSTIGWHKQRYGFSRRGQGCIFSLPSFSKKRSPCSLKPVV